MRGEKIRLHRYGSVGSGFFCKHFLKGGRKMKKLSKILIVVLFISNIAEADVAFWYDFGTLSDHANTPRDIDSRIENAGTYEISTDDYIWNFYGDSDPYMTVENWQNDAYFEFNFTIKPDYEFSIENIDLDHQSPENIPPGEYGPNEFDICYSVDGENFISISDGWSPLIRVISVDDWQLCTTSTNTDFLTGTVYIRIYARGADNGSWSHDNIYLNGSFRLLFPDIESPNGGEELIAGSQEVITWSSGIVDDIAIEYSSNNGATWQTINPNTPNDGWEEWTVPQVMSDQCLIRISDATAPEVYDTSDDVFTIFECQLESPADLNDDCIVNLGDFVILAQEWLLNGNPFDEGYTELLPIMWVYIDDPGIPDHEGFTGEMSKYETTNAQYCRFLNAALASGDITVSVNDAIGSSGSNGGIDYVDELYYDGDGLGQTYDGAINGGAARINYSGGVFSVDTGFEDHPVTYVSWYGAMAFCNYYGYRLPTQWEWQAAADYDGSFNYGCGTSINNSIANYYGSIHPDGTTVAGYFGVFGYGMCDMAGNVWEWTDSIYADYYRVIRGGSWNSYDSSCTVSSVLNRTPVSIYYYIGFRVCR